MRQIKPNTAVSINTATDILEMINHNTEFTRKTFNDLIRTTNNMKSKIFWLSVSNICLAVTIFKLTTRCALLEYQTKKENSEIVENEEK